MLNSVVEPSSKGLPAPEDVGLATRFLPEHCMMQKVHSGVVVHSEGMRVIIEGIDLKVW